MSPRTRCWAAVTALAPVVLAATYLVVRTAPEASVESPTRVSGAPAPDPLELPAREMPDECWQEPKEIDPETEPIEWPVHKENIVEADHNETADGLDRHLPADAFSDRPVAGPQQNSAIGLGGGASGAFGGRHGARLMARGGGAGAPPAVAPRPPAPVAPVAPVEAGEPEGMKFEAAGPNRVHRTADEARSTFGLDVDTGSYSIGRGYMQRGYLPPRESVRTEEYLNSFDYDYAEPTDGPFAIHLEGAPAPFEEGVHLLRIGLQSRRIRAADRKPAALTFVVDVSGSMNTDARLGLVKRSLSFLVERLREDDRVAIVVYGSHTRIALGPTPVADRATILLAIDGLVCNGSTNAEAGLRLGYQVALDNFVEGAENRVILCSDGVANVGRTGPHEILETIADHIDDGVTLATIGFGMGNYNDALMERLADEGNGMYAYVDRIDEARRIFGRDLTATLQTLATDAKIQVEFEPSVVERFQLVGYENRRLANEDFRKDDVDAGEVGSGHTVTALYRVWLVDGAQGTAATVRLRWADPDTGAVTEMERSLDRSRLADTFEKASSSFRLAALVASVAEVLKGRVEIDRLDDIGASLVGVALDHGDDPRLAELVRYCRALAVGAGRR